MPVLDARSWMEALPEAECWRRLRLSAVARLASVVDDRPMIWPLNIAANGEMIVFRTDPGSKLAALQGKPLVAVEVDGLDFDDHRGWSVVALGPVIELAGADLARARALPLAPWTVGEKPTWFGIRPTQISGRAIGTRAATTQPHGARR
jgi:nitroimidazol reductase NimA-like FMN-containing flavoprotein (pyridoxamine 5'-phosphate oxidase superfamily)